MQQVIGLAATKESCPTTDGDEQDCIELLKLARSHKARGEEKEAEQFYALLVQVLRPDHALAELQI
jgi:hypothetical protein